MKEKFSNKTTNQLKEEIYRDCVVSIKNYFNGAGNGVEMKTALLTLNFFVKKLLTKPMKGS